MDLVVVHDKHFDKTAKNDINFDFSQLGLSLRDICGMFSHKHLWTWNQKTLFRETLIMDFLEICVKFTKWIWWLFMTSILNRQQKMTLALILANCEYDAKKMYGKF